MIIEKGVTIKDIFDSNLIDYYDNIYSPFHPTFYNSVHFKTTFSMFSIPLFDPEDIINQNKRVNLSLRKIKLDSRKKLEKRKELIMPFIINKVFDCRVDNIEWRVV